MGIPIPITIAMSVNDYILFPQSYPGFTPGFYSPFLPLIVLKEVSICPLTRLTLNEFACGTRCPKNQWQPLKPRYRRNLRLVGR